MSDPLVSVVMPTRNDKDFIGAAIESVLQQAKSDLELIVIDDGSTDDTPQLVMSYAARDHRVQILHTGGSEGPAAARNVGVTAARGRFVAFLDSDDVWDRAKLDSQIDYMIRLGCLFTYTRFDLIDSSGIPFSAARTIPPSATYDSLLGHCFIRMSSVVYDQQSLGKVYFPNLRKRQDFAFFLELLKRTPTAWLVDQTLCSYRIRPNSVSARKLRNIEYQWAVYRNVERLTVLESSKLMATWSLKSGREVALRKWASLR